MDPVVIPYNPDVAIEQTSIFSVAYTVQFRPRNTRVKA